MRSYRHWLLWFAGLGCVLALAASVTQQSAKAQAMGEGGNYGLTTFGGGPLQLQLLEVDGSSSAPAYSFGSSSNSGIYFAGTGIAFSSSGNPVGFFNGTSSFQLFVPLAASSTITSSATADVGWSIASAANQACNTTCTFACVHGWNTASGEVAVSCTDATADKCLCAGPN